MVAPFDGTVTTVMLDVGEACQAQQPLVRLVDTRKCYFICNVEAKAGYTLKAGQTVKLDIEAGTRCKISAELFLVSPVVDPASGLMRVKVVFENPREKSGLELPGECFCRRRKMLNVNFDSKVNRSLSEVSRLRKFAGTRAEFWPAFVSAAADLIRSRQRHPDSQGPKK